MAKIELWSSQRMWKIRKIKKDDRKKLAESGRVILKRRWWKIR